MKNVTEIQTTFLSHDAVILILSVSTIPIIINIAYVIVCFKQLKKKLHNLLVLSLCVSDGFLGFSLTWYLVTKTSDFLRTSVAACLLQYFLVSYGLVSTYSLIMIISLERYAVVKSRNFGVNFTLNRFKYLIIFGTLAFGLMFTLESILFIPHQTTISRCNLDTLYAEEFGFFVTFMGGYISILMAITVVVSIITGYHIWQLFFRKKKRTHLEELSSSEKESFHNSVDINKNQNTLEMQPVAECSYMTPLSRNRKDDRTMKYDDEQAQRNDETTHNGGKEPTDNKVRVLIQILRTLRMKNERNVNPKQPYEKRIKTFKFDSWEVRAFSTSVIIALTTITLTGPLIISFWIDKYCGFCLAHSKMYLLLPLEINSILNPFIYAWRVPEIRDEFRKLFKRLRKVFSCSGGQ